MSITKKIHILLFSLIIQLGCSSSYPLDMENPGRKGRIETRSMNPKGKDNEKRQNEINKIIDKLIKKQGEKLQDGVKINHKAIKKAIENINKDHNINTVDIDSLPEDYVYFLNKYGSIHGKGHAISGPTDKKNINTNIKKGDYIASLQRGFKKSCLRLNKEPEKVKSYWLIADISDNEQCYIDVSDTEQGRGRIYCIDSMGNSKLFAKNFKEFLKEFCRSFSLRQENISSSESESGSESDSESNRSSSSESDSNRTISETD